MWKGRYASSAAEGATFGLKATGVGCVCKWVFTGNRVEQRVRVEGFVEASQVNAQIHPSHVGKTTHKISIAYLYYSAGQECEELLGLGGSYPQKLEFHLQNQNLHAQALR